MYKLKDNNSVIRVSDGALILRDMNNKAYQEYLRWCSGYRLDPEYEVLLDPSGSPVTFSTREWDEYIQIIKEIDSGVFSRCKNMPLPAYTLLERREKLKSLVNLKRSEKLTCPIKFQGDLYDTDQISTKNISDVLVMLGVGMTLPPDYVWRTTDNRNVPMSKQKLVGLAAAISTRNTMIYQYSWGMKKTIDNSNNPESIDINLGWPE
jgi:hypothetical protein